MEPSQRLLRGSLNNRQSPKKCRQGDHSEPQYWTEPQKEEGSEVDHLKLHYAVQPHKTKAINAFGTNP
ncbi:hypothetical protein ACFX1T_029411 [Malus domestica]